MAENITRTQLDKEPTGTPRDEVGEAAANMVGLSEPPGEGDENL